LVPLEVRFEDAHEAGNLYVEMSMGASPASLKSQFPFFANNPACTYLDYANTTPKPQSVIDAVVAYYSEFPSNVHRASHDIGSRADHAYEQARHRIAQWLGASENEIVFLKNTTEGINLVAQSYVLPRLQAGDKILCTGLEHHANLVSWQLIAERVGAEVVFSQLTEDGSFDYESWQAALTDGVKFAAFVAVSNVTGEKLPVTEMIALAHQRNIKTLVDGAQLLPHERVSVVDLDADFLVFSGHKVYGPTGVGVLYGRYELLDSMGPVIGGGDMIDTVTYAKATFQKPPLRFEAGTPPIASVIGLGATIDYLDATFSEELTAQHHALMGDLLRGLGEVEGVKILGRPTAASSLVSFEVKGVHAMDLGAYLNERGVAIRVGKLCAHPLFEHCGVSSGLRASIGLPTDADDVAAFVKAIQAGVKLFR
jgi:cysteine desulfurase / selenocysteine lyase